MKSAYESIHLEVFVSRPVPRSGYEAIGGIVFFARMLDKIRLQAAGELPDDYNLGTGFDAILCRFLRIDYPRLRERALQGGTDEELLEWAFAEGRRPEPEEIQFLNHFLSKRGWRDDRSEWLDQQKVKLGLAGRPEVRTSFDLHDADEGRPARFPSTDG